MNLSSQKICTALIFLFSAQFISSAQPATNLWTLELSIYDCDSSPALAPDGTIYQTTFDGKLFAVTPQGEIKWTFKTAREIESSPAIADDGTIYFGSRDRKFYAVTPQGKLKWTFATSAWNDSSPAIATDGTIYFGSWDTNFYALNPDGSLKWKFATGGIIVSSPAIGPDGTIYFGSHDKNFYALAPDGNLRWKFATQGQIVSSPALNSDGTIYFSSTDGNFYALNSDGSEKWRLHTGSACESSPALDGNGEIYIGDNNSKAGISESGQLLWRYGAPLFVDATPAVTANGCAYFPTAWRELQALDNKGNLRWSLSTADAAKNSPVVGSNGIIYLAGGRNLMAIAPTNSPTLAKSSWPMWRADSRHTGRISLNR